jgi:hypothetical protein
MSPSDASSDASSDAPSDARRDTSQPQGILRGFPCNTAAISGMLPGIALAWLGDGGRLARGVGEGLARGLHARGSGRGLAQKRGGNEADGRGGQKHGEDDLLQAARMAPLRCRLDSAVRFHPSSKQVAATRNQRTKSRATDSHTCPSLCLALPHLALPHLVLPGLCLAPRLVPSWRGPRRRHAGGTPHSTALAPAHADAANEVWVTPGSFRAARGT